jgi:hypothetical protein
MGFDPPQDPAVSLERIQVALEQRFPAYPEVKGHPLIVGLIMTLPPPDSDWPIEQQRKWLQAAASIFDLIYNDNTPADPRCGASSIFVHIVTEGP